jgi:hypothetical protein
MRRVVVSLFILVLLLSCRPSAKDGSTTAPAKTVDGATSAAAPQPITSTAIDAAPPPPAEREIGPYEVPFDGARNVYYVVPRSTKKPARLIANLHGVCNPPGYACGYWVDAASKVGFLVCPEGNAKCGNNPKGSPTWSQPMPKFDEDLEKAIATVDTRYPGEIDREGAILTGFSLGAWAAYHIAKAHPGRWKYLILTEADVPLDAAQLRAADVRAVALLAGENGTQVAGERRTAERLKKAGYPAQLWVMKGAGHHYSADIDTLMAEAMEFVLSAGADAGR